MIFSAYKNQRSPLAKLRQQSTADPVGAPARGATACPEWVNDEYADLLSRDKLKQKEAVKRYLAAKVKNDWVFNWSPPSLQQQPNSSGAEKTVAAPQATSSRSSEVLAPVEGPKEPVQDETKDDGYEVDDESDREPDRISIHQEAADDDSIYSIMSEDPLHYQPRMDWTSDLSDDEPRTQAAPSHADQSEDEYPDEQTSLQARKDKRRREAREEALHNPGLACFEARRNAWTGARTVRVRAKPAVSATASPRSPRRFFFRRSISSSPPAVAAPATTATAPGTSGTQSTSAAETSGVTSDGSSVANHEKDQLKKFRTKDSAVSAPVEASYPVEIMIPRAPPILPPDNVLRASINPTVYINLYEKVILHNLQPSCPINLTDMIRSCVVGWQRDGEWPPRPAIPNATPIPMRKKAPGKKKTSINGSEGNNVARRMSFGLLGNQKEEDTSKAGKGFRRSLQKAFGIGSGLGGSEQTNAGEKA